MSEQTIEPGVEKFADNLVECVEGLIAEGERAKRKEIAVRIARIHNQTVEERVAKHSAQASQAPMIIRTLAPSDPKNKGIYGGGVVCDPFGGPDLLTVATGVPVNTVLRLASDLIEQVRLMEDRDGTLYPFFMELAKGMVDAAINAIAAVGGDENERSAA